MPEFLPQVSVIIITHNSMPILQDCLAGLREALQSVRSELIVVDNASEDDSREAIQQAFPDALILRNQFNRGFALACNQAAEMARGNYLVFLNPDVVLDLEAVETLLVAARTRQDAGLLTGRLRFPDGRFQSTCRQFPTVGNLLFSRGSALSLMLGERTDKTGKYTLIDGKNVRQVPAVAATFAMVATDLFRAVGGFDERFFLYVEDTDLSYRLQLQGYRNFFVPAAGGVHHWGRGSRTGRITRNWRHHVSLLKYFSKHNGWLLVMLLALPAMLHVLMSDFAILFSGERHK